MGIEPTMALRSMSRRAVVAWVAAAVIVAGGGSIAGYLLSRSDKGTDPSAAMCHEVKAIDAMRDDARPVTRGSIRAVVLGDSYAEGLRLTDPRAQAWSTLLGRDEHWTTTVNAIGGTGFVNDGPCGGQQYASRVRAVLAAHPSVVVVEGGLNDLGAHDLRVAATSLLAQLRSVPRVIVVGPTAAPARSPADEQAADRAMAAAAAAAHRQYISTLRWQLPFGPDRLHLTPAGHRLFAAAIAARIRSAAPPVKSG